MSEMKIHHGTVYLAGPRVAEDALQDIRGQTRQVLAMVDKLLREASTDNAHILRAEIFLADMADFAAMNEVWDDWSPPATPPPATDAGAPGQARVEDRDHRHRCAVDRVGRRRSMTIRCACAPRSTARARPRRDGGGARPGAPGRAIAWATTWLHWRGRATSR